MSGFVLGEENYRQEMEQTVLPYLQERKKELWLEREPGRRIYGVCCRADRPRGIVVISHGFTETTEKYRECFWYFLRMGYHVYGIDHCGHGRSYRLTEDFSLVHTDSYERYVKDLVFAAEYARNENGALPLFLYAHSMGGGIGAAAAAYRPRLFRKVILTSPMIRPQTGPVPWQLAVGIAESACMLGHEKAYAAGQKPYSGSGCFEKSAAGSRARFEYYKEIRESSPRYQMNAASYGWLKSAGQLNWYLQSQAWKRILSPVLLFQAGEDAFVSNREQERWLGKLKRRADARLVRVRGVKHEIYNAGEETLVPYWKKIFAFFREGEASSGL